MLFLDGKYCSHLTTVISFRIEHVLIMTVLFDIVTNYIVKMKIFVYENELELEKQKCRTKSTVLLFCLIIIEMLFL